MSMIVRVVVASAPVALALAFMAGSSDIDWPSSGGTSPSRAVASDIDWPTSGQDGVVTTASDAGPSDIDWP
ncbi:hypothetical protein [Streptomyces sp. NPDC059398]|uniref:hypothetical protein n=1 Tax=Streptomyces sp. NPDC059398 TaxID=3346820 RepID=UPI0036B99E86